MERKIKVYIENIGCTRRGLDVRRISSAISCNDEYVITQSLNVRYLPKREMF